MIWKEKWKRYQNENKKEVPRRALYLYTQGIRTEANCREYTNLEGIILAISMVRFNEFVDVGYQSYSQQYQLGKGLKKFGEDDIKPPPQSLNSSTIANVFTQCQLKIWPEMREWRLKWL